MDEPGFTVEDALFCTHLSSVYRSIDEFMKSTREASNEENIDHLVDMVAKLNENNNCEETKSLVRLLISLGKVAREEDNSWKMALHIIFMHMEHMIRERVSISDIHKMEEAIGWWN